MPLSLAGNGVRCGPPTLALASAIGIAKAEAPSRKGPAGGAAPTSTTARPCAFGMGIAGMRSADPGRTGTGILHTLGTR
eukprot:4503465-Prymnesium_polylepis.1